MPGRKRVRARLPTRYARAALYPAMTIQRRVKDRGLSLRAALIGVISESFSACSLRLAAQDVALSRRKQGFESPRERHVALSYWFFWFTSGDCYFVALKFATSFCRLS